MIIIRTQLDSIAVIDGMCAIEKTEFDSGYAIMVKQPRVEATHSDIFDRVATAVQTSERTLLAKTATAEAADRVLAILWRHLAASNRIDMADVLREAGA